ncbi:sulfatase [Thalassotalea litorea]|uniref:Sulfatase n=1 Tax=Thalassotalea litorea TaxID=2020715 RepID=A0A5R9IUV6_9GAMM|nr:sulfatase [Thalassotalea litorea]TLU65728.1 sulfatase [Thalassotalea litorea]
MTNNTLLTISLSFIAIVLSGLTKTQAGDNASTALAHTNKPNIIFYLADDQDVYDYGVYGNEKVHTPAIDQLANQGMLFENAFTAQAICAPSRTQLFTGKYPLKNGAFANHTPTRPNIKSVTKHMRALGYDVVLAGKSHVKPANIYDWDHEWQPIPKAGVPRDYIPLADIETYFKTVNKPFVMFITSKYPHGKYFDVKNPNPEDLKFHPYDEHLKHNETYVKKKAGYYRSIEEDNTQLEHVLALVDTHLTDNTLFIYSADHGVSGKFGVKDIGLKVPFIVRWPNVIKPNSRSEQLIHYTDVLPTFIDIAGGNADQSMDGKSFLTLLNGADKAIHQYVYGVRTNQNIINAHIFPSRMIRSKRYKYIRNFNALEVLDKNLGDKPNINAFLRLGAMQHPNEPFEALYDLESDPFEQHNLIAVPELTNIKNRLQKQLFTWMSEQGDFLTEGFGNIPVITAPAFKLDQNNPPRRTSVDKALENTLKPQDYLLIEHWQESMP